MARADRWDARRVLRGGVPDAGRVRQGLTWRLEDLAALEDEAAYYLVVVARNVMIFLHPGTGPPW